MICYKNIKKPALRRNQISVLCSDRFRIKRIAIRKCILFFHYGDAKEISHFTTFTMQKLWAIILMDINGIMFVRQINGV